MDRVVYVVPSTYSELELKDRHAIANLIGRLSDTDAALSRRTLLVGPGTMGHHRSIRGGTDLVQ